MTQAIVAHFPVFNPFLPKNHKDLANKKVAGVALSKIEEFKHHCLLKTTNYRHFYNLKSHRVVELNDVKLYDTTRDSIGGVEVSDNFDCVSINEMEVAFTNGVTADGGKFSRLAGTDYVVVSDCPERDKISICEKTISTKSAKNWIVNTRLALHTLIPAVKQVFGWVNIEIKPPENIYMYIAHFQHEPIIDSRIVDDKALIEANKSQIHSFADSRVSLLDSTKNGIASVIYDPIHKTEYICLNGKRVNYQMPIESKFITSYTPFCRDYPGNTSHVIVSDTEHPHFVMIVQMLTKSPNTSIRRAKMWFSVNLAK